MLRSRTCRGFASSAVSLTSSTPLGCCSLMISPFGFHISSPKVDDRKSSCQAQIVHSKRLRGDPDGDKGGDTTYPHPEPRPILAKSLSGHTLTRSPSLSGYARLRPFFLAEYSETARRRLGLDEYVSTKSAGVGRNDGVPPAPTNLGERTPAETSRGENNSSRKGVAGQRRPSRTTQRAGASVWVGGSEERALDALGSLCSGDLSTAAFRRRGAYS